MACRCSSAVFVASTVVVVVGPVPTVAARFAASMAAASSSADDSNLDCAAARVPPLLSSCPTVTWPSTKTRPYASTVSTTSPRSWQKASFATLAVGRVPSEPEPGLTSLPQPIAAQLSAAASPRQTT